MHVFFDKRCKIFGQIHDNLGKYAIMQQYNKKQMFFEKCKKFWFLGLYKFLLKYKKVPFPISIF